MFRAPPASSSAYFATSLRRGRSFSSVTIATRSPASPFAAASILFFIPENRMGSPRLNAPAAQHFRAGFRHALRRLMIVFPIPPSTARPSPRIPRRRFPFHSLLSCFTPRGIPAHEFVRRRNPHHVVPPAAWLDRFHHAVHHPTPPPDPTPLFPFDGVHLVSEVLHLLRTSIDLFPCMTFMEMIIFPALSINFVPKTKNPLAAEWVGSFFLLNRLQKRPSPPSW